MSDPLHIKYRPASLEDVIGHDEVVKSIAQQFERGRAPKTWLFSGPSGTGKTTLARIIATMLECPALGLMEVDGGRFSGVDQMRELLKSVQYRGMDGNGTRCVVVDECHRISKAAWDACLITAEQPPEHLYWMFCTTEPEKIPNTVQTRSMAYSLKPVPWDLLANYLEAVAEEEQIKVKREFLDMAARKAEGSVRQSLVYLALLEGITEKEEARRLLDSAADGAASEDLPEGALARMLVSGRGLSWKAARKCLVDAFERGTSPESVRIVVSNYAAGALLRCEGDKEAGRLCAVLQAFAAPGADKSALLLAVGTLLFGD